MNTTDASQYSARLGLALGSLFRPIALKTSTVYELFHYGKDNHFQNLEFQNLLNISKTAVPGDFLVEFEKENFVIDGNLEIKVWF